jgi:hypothetical protein
LIDRELEIPSLNKLKEFTKTKSKINKITSVGTYTSRSIDGRGNDLSNRGKSTCELGSSVR